MSDALVLGAGEGAEGYTEIVVGEQTRGGQSNVLGAQDAITILGELAARNPALANYVQKRVAANRPIVQKVPLRAAQDWQIDFGPVSGAINTTTTITNNPQCLFKAEKVMATDTSATAGMGTFIQGISVGQKNQRPSVGGTGTLTLFFAQNALGNGISWNTCAPGYVISVTVSFAAACTFVMTVFGKAVV